MDQPKKIYVVSSSEEWWPSNGEFGSREDAIDEGNAAYDPGTTFYTGIKGDPPIPEIDAQHLDMLFEEIDEELARPDEMDPWPDSTVEQRADLSRRMTAVLHAWMAEHNLQPKWWIVGDVQAHTVPAAVEAK